MDFLSVISDIYSLLCAGFIMGSGYIQYPRNNSYMAFYFFIEGYGNAN